MIKVRERTARTRTLEVRGDVVKVKFFTKSTRFSGYKQKTENDRVVKSMSWVIDVLPGFNGTRKELEAILLAYDSGLTWEDASKATEADFHVDDGALF